MKVLLDQNISEKLVDKISDLYPGSSHIKVEGLDKSDDTKVWAHAKDHGFAIVSKDVDFHQRSLLWGHPPKVIHVAFGNCSTSDILQGLRDNQGIIEEFNADANESLLVLTRTKP